jgi:hypothetical protein
VDGAHQQLEASIGTLMEELGRGTQDMATYENATADAAVAEEYLSTTAEEGSFTIEQLSQTVDDTSRSLVELSAAADEAATALMLDASALEEDTVATTELTSAAESDTIALEGETVAALEDATAQTSDAVAKERNALAAKKAAAGNSALSQSFKNVAGPLTMAGAALAGITAGSLVLQGTYEQSMTVVQHLTGRTAEEMKMLDAGVMKMAQTMGQGPDELAGGLYFLLSAGVKTTDVLGVLQVVTEASAGAMVDAATYADGLTSALNAYGMGADQARHFSDLLLTTVKDGKTTMDQLASAVGRAGVMGSQAGILVRPGDGGSRHPDPGR